MSETFEGGGSEQAGCEGFVKGDITRAPLATTHCRDAQALGEGDIFDAQGARRGGDNATRVGHAAPGQYLRETVPSFALGGCFLDTAAEVRHRSALMHRQS